MADRTWRSPATTERALLDTLLQAETPHRDILRAQLDGVLVAEMRCAGEASLDLNVRDGVPRLPEGHTAAIVDAEGLDAAGQRVSVSLLAANGLLTRLEVLYLGTAAPSPIDLATLRQLDAVPRGTRELVWLVPRKRPILGS